MSSLHTIEIDGDLVGILTRDHTSRAFRFHSGIAPYDLLDGSSFHKPQEAHDAAVRMSRVARRVKTTDSSFERIAR